MKRSTVGIGASAVALIVGMVIWSTGGGVRAQVAQVPMDRVSIGGVVLNKSQAPEAGVWVIAETSSLPTHYRRIVVTDDQGRFLVPDLPEGAYEVWVRGYGLRDSVPVKASRGERLTLQVSNARNPQEAAKIYPANYWLSLYEPPPEHELPDLVTSTAGSRYRPKGFTTRQYWLGEWKYGCLGSCHQLGGALTRLWTRPDDWEVLWKRAGRMNTTATDLGREALKKSLADWGSRIAAGEVPPAPPRPAGVERNMVVTQWEWGTSESYIHDLTSTDKRDPTLYPFGKVYGVDYGQDRLYALDPVTHRVTSYKIPTRNVSTDPPTDWIVLNNPGGPHNPMLDDKGRVWITFTIRPRKEQPRWAREAIVTDTGEAPSDDFLREYAETGSKQLAYLDPKTEQFVLVDTAYGTHHLQFDREGRLWTTGDSTALGMFDPSKFDPNNPYETAGRAQKAWVGIDHTTGVNVGSGGYGIVPNPVDGTIWRSYPRTYGRGISNKLNKFDPKTGKFTDYPLPPPGYNPKGIDATTDGKLWFGTLSGHLGRFDPKTEQFTYWESPGPKLKGTEKEGGTADLHYYIWVDQFDTLGLGKDMVMLCGTNSDAVLAFDPKTERFTVIRVPFPLGMFHRGLDGRIDDPKAGWKGRGLWVDYGGDPILMTEKTQIGYVNHIQLRPDPLAR